MQPLCFVINACINDKCQFQWQFLETSLNRLIKRGGSGEYFENKKHKNSLLAYKEQLINRMEEKHTLLFLKSVPHLFSPNLTANIVSVSNKLNDDRLS